MILDSLTSGDAKEEAMRLGQELLAGSRVELLADIGDEEGDVDPYELEDASVAAERERPTPGLDFLNWPIYQGRYSPSPDRVRDSLDKGARRILQARKAQAKPASETTRARLDAARNIRSTRFHAERKRLIDAFKGLRPTIAVDPIGQAVLYQAAWNKVRANPEAARRLAKPIGDRIAARRFPGVTYSQVRRGRERHEEAVEAALGA